MANKYLAYLDSEANYPLFAPSFRAFAATERLARIFRDGIVRPGLAAQNAPQETKEKALAIQAKFDEDDERGYGFLVLALEKVPLLRNKLLAMPVVNASPCSGMVLWRALQAEILNNPNRSVYTAILERIDMYQANDTSIPEALLALDNMYAMLPVELIPTDSAKCLQLRHSLPKHYANIVHTASIANPLATYSSVCETLLAEYRSQVVLQMKKSTLESDAVHLAAAGQPATTVAAADDADEVNYSSANGERGRSSYDYNHRSSSRSPGRYDRNSDSRYERNSDSRNDRQSSSYYDRHSNSRFDSSSRSDRSGYRSSSRDRSRSRDRHAPASFRGGRRSKSPNYRRSQSPHRTVRFTPSPARGILKPSAAKGIKCHNCEGYGHKAAICPSNK